MKKKKVDWYFFFKEKNSEQVSLNRLLVNVSPSIDYFLLNNGPFFFFENKVQNCYNFYKKINMIIYLDNFIARVYVLNKHIKFHINQMLFIIRSINLFFIHNFILQKFQI